MTNLELDIQGMTCEHCARTASEALNALPGVQAEVSYKKGLARITLQGTGEIRPLIEALAAKGYRASLHPLADSTPPRTRHADLHIAIVGSGGAASAAALRAAEAGARVSVIEGADVIGGTCVNTGCVPSKILLRAAHLAHLPTHHAFDGITSPPPSIDRAALQRQQQARVAALRHAKYEHVLSSHPSITLIRGQARLQDANTLTIALRGGGEHTLRADRILLAVGSRPARPPIIGLADTPYWTSTEALLAQQPPRHLLVIGASAVAVELAQAFHRLGSAVTLLARRTLLSKFDAQLGLGLQEVLQAEGMRVLTHTQVRTVFHHGDEFVLHTTAGELRGDRLLVATGRQANTDSLGLAQAGVATNQHGAILVDEHLRTTAATVYAAGDCTEQPQLVYVAAAAGTRAARNMLGEATTLDLSILPVVVFTDPQVATVGLTEEDAIQQGLAVTCRTLSLDNVPRALANFDTRGFIQLVAETTRGRLVGAHVLAANAGEILQIAALAIRQGMSVEELANQLFPYLTLAEGLKLCAQTFSRDVTQLSCCAG